MKRLPDKIAPITGGAAGIGRETARLFRDAGASVALVDLGEDDLAKTVDDLTGDILTIAADVSSPGDTARYVRQTVDRFGRIASDESAFITGAQYPVDGGMAAG